MDYLFELLDIDFVSDNLFSFDEEDRLSVT